MITIKQKSNRTKRWVQIGGSFLGCRLNRLLMQFCFSRQFPDGISTHDLAPKLLINKGDHALLSLRARQLFVVLSFPDRRQEISDIWQAHTNGDPTPLVSDRQTSITEISLSSQLSPIHPLRMQQSK